MKGEKQGTAEWLRGRSQRLRSLGEFSCKDFMAYKFGISSPCKHPRSCLDCYADMFERIADRIDAERALPEGMEWPRFEDGGLVRIGDELEFEGKTMLVCDATFCADGWALWCSREGIDGRLSGSFGERVKRPTHKVLDADGVPIEVGDTVWATYNGCKHIVMAVCSDGSLHPEILTNDGCMVEYEEGLWDFAKKVTHERPDSWRLWGEDLDMAAKVGEVDKVEMMRRAKALAKAGEGL